MRAIDINTLLQRVFVDPKVEIFLDHYPIVCLTSREL